MPECRGKRRFGVTDFVDTHRLRAHLLREYRRGFAVSTTVSSKRKLLVGACVVAIADAVVVVGQYYPPRNGQTAGTIVPVDRYRAEQVSNSDVKLGDQTTPTLMQTDAFQAASQAAAQASSQSATGSLPAPAAPQVTVNVTAMDSQSFMDHSNDIANAVREAMLNMHPINGVVATL